jgi:hypothetical protein
MNDLNRRDFLAASALAVGAVAQTTARADEPKKSS